VDLSSIFTFLVCILGILLGIRIKLSVKLHILLDLSAVHMVVVAVVVARLIVRRKVAEAIGSFGRLGSNPCISDNSTILTLNRAITGKS
jgi:hypothetical protein